MNYLIVFVGGGLGAAARFGLNLSVPRVFGNQLPWHTLIINITGCFVMGAITAWLASRPSIAAEWKLFLTTGILGGYTTFSAFALDFASLLERGDSAPALAYAVASVVFSILACFAGLAIVRAFA